MENPSYSRHFPIPVNFEKNVLKWNSFHYTNTPSIPLYPVANTRTQLWTEKLKRQTPPSHRFEKNRKPNFSRLQKQQPLNQPLDQFRTLYGKNNLLSKLQWSQPWHCLQKVEKGSVRRLAINFASRSIAYWRLTVDQNKSPSTFTSFLLGCLDPSNRSEQCLQYEVASELPQFRGNNSSATHEQFSKPYSNLE